MRFHPPRLFFVVSFVVCTAAVAAAFPGQYPTGLTIYKPEKAYPGIVFFTGPDGIIRAISPDGQVVREWVVPIPDPEIRYGYARPLDDRNMLLVRMNTPYPVAPALMALVDENGDFQWLHGDPERLFHHDHDMQANGNVVILCSREISVPSISDKPLEDDCIVEVDLANHEVVFEWQTADHFDQFEFFDEAKALIFENGGDWGHANALSVVPPNPNEADPSFRPGNLILSYRNLNAIIIVDRLTGDIVWRVDDVTIGQHHAHMIPAGFPGAGNILVFDNGYSNNVFNPTPGVPIGRQLRSYSRVIEIDPLAPHDDPPFEYHAGKSGLPLDHFFSFFISGAERMPNGNTLITEGASGRIFEVTVDGEIVWEWVSPYTSVVRGLTTNRIFRAHKIQLPSSTSKQATRNHRVAREMGSRSRN